MTLVNLALWAAGIALIVLGYSRARVPYRRYMALREQEANVARYQAWRGGVRGRDATGPTGASVAMRLLRRQAQIGGAILIAGVVLVFLGFAIR